MDDITRAMLGDHDAAKRLSEQGVLIPCWRCGGDAEVLELHADGKPIYIAACKKHHCGAYGCTCRTKQETIGYWNTRAPLLTPEQMDELEERLRRCAE